MFMASAWTENPPSTEDRSTVATPMATRTD